METRANYTLIGAFTLLVMAGVFGFVYWFMRPLTNEDRKAYEIVYSAPSAAASGQYRDLQRHSGGTGGEARPCAGRPNEVLVRVDVDANVPVLSDARAGLESQGLTGIVAVAIRGGEPGAKPLPIGPNGCPVSPPMADRAWPG